MIPIESLKGCLLRLYEEPGALLHAARHAGFIPPLPVPALTAEAWVDRIFGSGLAHDVAIVTAISYPKDLEIRDLLKPMVRAGVRPEDAAPTAWPLFTPDSRIRIETLWLELKEVTLPSAAAPLPPPSGKAVQEGALSMPLSYRDFISGGLLDEIAIRFRDPTRSRILLEKLGYPSPHMPAWPAGTNPLEWWHNVCNQICMGITPGGLEALLAQAAEAYPYVDAFRPFHPDGAELYVNPDSRAGGAEGTPTGMRPPSVPFPMPLTLKYVIQEGYLKVLAGLIRDERRAWYVLRGIGFPAHEVPLWNGCEGPLDFWQRICTGLSAGIALDGDTGDGLLALFRFVAKEHPNQADLRIFL